MAANNGGKVTTREFYEALLDLKDEAAERERRILAAMDNQTRQFSKKLDNLVGLPEKVKKLEDAESKWKIATIFATGVGTFLAWWASLK